MAIKIHGTTSSPFVHLIEVVAKQAGVPYEFVPVDVMAGEHTTAEYLTKHPFGQLPYMVRRAIRLPRAPPPLTARTQDDNGFVLFESRAVARYVVAKAGATTLLPPESDLQAHALFEQAASIEVVNFSPHAATIIVQRLAAPMRGGTTDEARVCEAIDALSSRLEGYERMLGKRRFLAGERLTIADLFHLPLGSLLATAGVALLADDDKHPNVSRYVPLDVRCAVCASDVLVSYLDGGKKSAPCHRGRLYKA